MPRSRLHVIHLSPICTPPIASLAPRPLLVVDPVTAPTSKGQSCAARRHKRSPETTTTQRTLANIEISALSHPWSSAGAPNQIYKGSKLTNDAEQILERAGVDRVEAAAPGDMLRLLSWGTNLGGDKMTIPAHSCLNSQEHAPLPRKAHTVAGLKRKRSSTIQSSISPETFNQAVVGLDETISTLQDGSSVSTALTKETMDLDVKAKGDVEGDKMEPTKSPEGEPNSSTAAKSLLSEEEKCRFRQVIDHQLGLEILLKHRELRLIDQEIAKCQIALEQLRRCSEIPYPVTRNSPEVSQGVGPAVRRPGLRPLPESPPAWGVIDGPYTRHYAQWLLPDPRFDGGEIQPLPGFAGKMPVGRSTRGTYVDIGIVSSTRTSLASKGAGLRGGIQSQPHVKSGPTLLKRKRDGAMVKLVCVDCGRSDFGSPQGFINHCRIQHQRNYASHDAAADEAGETVEVDNSGAVVGQELTTMPASNLVHPLIRSARTIQPIANLKVGTQNADSSVSLDRPRNQGPAADLVPNVSTSNFNPSPTTPHLSELVRHRGLGLDLANLVTDARTRIVIPEPESEEEDGMDLDTPVELPQIGRRPPAVGSKHLSHAQMSPATSPNLARAAFASISASEPILRGGGYVDTHATNPNEIFRRLSSHSHQPISDGLEPSPTESHQAPSLVDDDGVDEAHSPPTSLISGDEGMSVDFLVEDGENCQEERHQFPLPGLHTEYQKQPAAAISGSQAGPASSRNRLTSPGKLERREVKHVSFTPPSVGVATRNATNTTTHQPPKPGAGDRKHKRRRTSHT